MVGPTTPDVFHDTLLTTDPAVYEAANTYMTLVDSDVVIDEVIPDHALSWTQACRSDEEAEALLTAVFCWGLNKTDAEGLTHEEAYARSYEALNDLRRKDK